MATPFLQPHSPAFFCVRALDFFLFCSVFLGSPVGRLPRGITGTPGAGSTFQPGGNLWGERFAAFQQPEQQGEAKGAPFTLKLSNPHSRTRQTNPPNEYLLFLSVHNMVRPAETPSCFVQTEHTTQTLQEHRTPRCPHHV